MNDHENDKSKERARYDLSSVVFRATEKTRPLEKIRKITGLVFRQRVVVEDRLHGRKGNSHEQRDDAVAQLRIHSWQCGPRMPPPQNLRPATV